MSRHSDDHYWILETQTSAYVFGLNQHGRLVHAYWGPRLPRRSDYPPPPDPPGLSSFDPADTCTPEEYPAAGGTRYGEPCLKVSFPDGARSTDLRFISARQDDDTQGWVITLRDAVYPLWVELHYRIHSQLDLIERWVVLRNTGPHPVTVERVFSAVWHLPRFETGCRLSHLAGRWADEFRLVREPVYDGTKIIESRRGTTSHQASPWFAVDSGCAAEDSGPVWFGTLAWSGSWKICAEQPPRAAPRISLGINDWDFALQLSPGERYAAPPCLAGYTPGGFGAASRALHHFIRARLPHAGAAHKILYNSWEATLFDVDEASQKQLAEIAAGLGVELFVLDDGWFRGRRSDSAGLGDWQPDPLKFPTGLGGLAGYVNQLGMDFGLWIEPEMVNPNSDLYRAHPDWVLHYPQRPRTEARNQLVLNFARADVQEYMIETIDRLLNSAPIAFIKWDMNRNFSEPGWPAAGERQREIWLRYVEGLYRVWGELAHRHPQVTWQSCSGGGGRADLAVLRLADQIWTSDNTEATARLRIQEGFSQLFPAAVMEAWVTDMGAPLIPLEFRFHAAMCGSLGLGGNLLHWTGAERETARRLIAQYKDIRAVIQSGDQYRLRSAQENAFSALQYTAPDGSEAVLFAFRTFLPEPAEIPVLHLRGLDPGALYLVDGFSQPRSGLAWMLDGLHLELGNFCSTLRRIYKIED